MFEAYVQYTCDSVSVATMKGEELVFSGVGNVCLAYHVWKHGQRNVQCILTC